MLPTNAGLLTPLLGDPSPWTPRRLFALGEPGGWYDPSDLTPQKVAWALANPGFTPAQFLAQFPDHALFEDDAGTTPVTALGQPVGRVLDKSGNGNTLVQATAGDRPVLDARVNLLLATATLATQSVAVYTETYRLSFTGTGTVTLSGAYAGALVGTGAGTRVALEFVAIAGTLTLTVSGTVIDADLRLTEWRDYPYQAVVTATDYADVAAPRAFLWYGAGDALTSAASVAFGTTSASTVVAGLAKASEAATGTVVQLTASVSGNTGAFAMLAPSVASGVNVQALSKGTVAQAVATGAQAPLPLVLSAVADIVADTLTLRKNAAQVDTNGGNQGTGPYSTATLYVGPLAGRIYQLIVRGAVTAGRELLVTEQYVGAKMNRIMPPVAELFDLLLEDGSRLLLEDGFAVLQET